MIIQTYTTWESYLVHEQIKVINWKRGQYFQYSLLTCDCLVRQTHAWISHSGHSQRQRLLWLADWQAARESPDARHSVMAQARMRRLLECIQAKVHWCLDIAFRANWSLIKNLRWILFRTLTFRRQFSCLQWITQVCYCSCLTFAYAPFKVFMSVSQSL